MNNFKEKLKNFFADKLNLTVVILLAVFIIMVIIPYDNLIYIKAQMLILSVVLLIFAWKLYKKYKKDKEIYEMINCEKQSSKSVFGRISDGYDTFNQKNNLIYAIGLAIIAVMIIVYIFIKW